MTKQHKESLRMIVNYGSADVDNRISAMGLYERYVIANELPIGTLINPDIYNVISELLSILDGTYRGRPKYGSLVNNCQPGHALTTNHEVYQLKARDLVFHERDYFEEGFRIVGRDYGLTLSNLGELKSDKKGHVKAREQVINELIHSISSMSSKVTIKRVTNPLADMVDDITNGRYNGGIVINAIRGNELTEQVASLFDGLYTFNVDDGYLSCNVAVGYVDYYNYKPKSLLGNAILLGILAKVCGLKAGVLSYSTSSGYINAIDTEFATLDALRESSHELPILKIGDINSLDECSLSDIEIIWSKTKEGK